MKNIFIILGLVGFITSFISCNEDEILTIENPNSLNADNFWQNQGDAESGIYSVYSALQFTGAMGSTATLSLALRSEVGRVGNTNRGPNLIQLEEGLVNSANGNITDMWSDVYKIILRANQVLANVPNIEMNEKTKKEILGEAYFLRGLAMFWTANTFNEGKVPYPLVVPTSVDESRYSLQTREFVYNQIIEDLLQAQTNLKDRLDWAKEKQQGRATWGAVTSILGKVYLYEENPAKAKEEFLKVIDSNQYSLTENIADNFNEAGEFNKESIFEVQYSVSVVDDGSFGDGEGNNPDEGSLRPVVWSRTGGWSSVFCTHFMSALYRNEVIDPNLPINNIPVTIYDKGYKPDADEATNEPFISTADRSFSVRSEASVAFEGDGSLFYLNTTRDDAFIRVHARAQIKRFAEFHLATNRRNSGMNERVIRLADVYLMYAEAILREQGDAAITEALTYINRVRQRSGLVTLETLFSGIPIPPIIKNTFPDITDPLEIQAIINELHPSLKIEPQELTSTNIIRHLFDIERPAEFAWEGRGISWHDLRRRPTNLIDGAVRRLEKLSEVNYNPVTIDIQDYEKDDLNDFRGALGKFDEDDFFFPIPASELIQNPNLGN